ncbi:cell wall metabolism sensor histidine kinase WalK [Paenibacillus sp. SC116]|uniref:sensor histidine kinase n=1 Tax=Paenibacillus sp. SC116 TaxID=2968986 RepID=UPI00215B038C|nr:ATP-binding protein [Paenibacillus sp. SC116]
MKPSGEWGIALLPFKNNPIRINVMWKLIVINVAVIGIAIWLAGVSVKDYACLLFANYPSVSPEDSVAFTQTMQTFLIKASLLAVVIAGVFHFYFVKKLLHPLKKLSDATRQMAQGEMPEPLSVHVRDEIGQLTVDFNQLSLKLRQVDELRKKMLSDIAHELRTPLTNINGYLEALSTGIIKGSREMYESLHEESIRITRLVEQLHQLNVWQAKKISNEQELKVLPIHKIIESCIDHFALKFKSRGITLRCNIESAQVVGDEDGLIQALHNLLTNVLQYDQGGWVTIVGKLNDSHNDYRVTITNIGQSIPDEQASLIFERFYRLDSSRSRDTGGSGLGLSLVKEIVEQQGGKTGLHSVGNEHSFWLTVPVH